MAPRSGPSPKAGPPYRFGGRQDPNSNDMSGPITPSNKSSQTPQAASQNVPQGRGMTSGASAIAGAGSGKRVVRNGRVPSSFR